VGLFDLFKKKDTEPKLKERMENFPELLTARLLFSDKPNFDKQKVLNELAQFYKSVDSPTEENMFLFFFPDIHVGEKESSIPAQCSLFFTDERHKVEIEPEGFQQNWHWKEAKEIAQKCNFEIIASDFMTKSLDYKTRLELFMNFIVAVTKATNPQAIYFSTSQKLIQPSDLIDNWTGNNKIPLQCLVNFRLFNIQNNNDGSVIMDTIGLHSLGLSDFEILFKSFDENLIAQTLWNYANYAYQQGDIIEDGNTLAGLSENSKWKCTRQVSLTTPSRIVISVNAE
jgi:hypothetical protein